MSASGTIDFAYTPEEWAKAAEYLMPTEDAPAIQMELEDFGRRYLLTLSGDPDASRRDAEKKQRATIQAAARQLLAAIEGISGEDIGLGIVLDAEGNRDQELTRRSSVDELTTLRKKLAGIVAWLAVDELRFVPKSSNAQKSNKDYLAFRILSLWRNELGRPLRNDGDAIPRAARFLMATANPILSRMGDGISNADAARRIIDSFMEARREYSSTVVPS